MEGEDITNLLHLPWVTAPACFIESGQRLLGLGIQAGGFLRLALSLQPACKARDR